MITALLCLSLALPLATANVLAWKWWRAIILIRRAEKRLAAMSTRITPEQLQALVDSWGSGSGGSTTPPTLSN